MCEKPPIGGFIWVNKLLKFNESLIKSYNKNCDRGYFLQVDVEYPKNIFDSHEDLSYLAERKILGKVEKLVCSIKDKEKYVVHMRTLKQALNHGLIPKKVHQVIHFNQKVWLKPYINMNTKLTKEAK